MEFLNSLRSFMLCYIVLMTFPFVIAAVQWLGSILGSMFGRIVTMPLTGRVRRPKRTRVSAAEAGVAN